MRGFSFDLDSRHTEFPAHLSDDDRFVMERKFWAKRYFEGKYLFFLLLLLLSIANNIMGRKRRSAGLRGLPAKSDSRHTEFPAHLSEDHRFGMERKCCKGCFGQRDILRDLGLGKKKG